MCEPLCLGARPRESTTVPILPAQPSPCPCTPSSCPSPCCCTPSTVPSMGALPQLAGAVLPMGNKHLGATEAAWAGSEAAQWGEDVATARQGAPCVLPARKLRQGEGAESQEGYGGTPGSQSSILWASRDWEGTPEKGQPPSPWLLATLPMGSTAPLLQQQCAVGRQGVYSTAKHRDGISHKPQLLRGQCWGQRGWRREQGSYPRWVRASRGLGAGQCGGVTRAIGSTSLGGVGCSGWEMGIDTATRAPEGKEVTCSPGPWEQDEQEQVWGNRQKKRNIPARDLGKKLPKGAAEEEE